MLFLKVSWTAVALVALLAIGCSAGSSSDATSVNVEEVHQKYVAKMAQYEINPADPLAGVVAKGECDVQQAIGFSENYFEDERYNEVVDEKLGPIYDEHRLDEDATRTIGLTLRAISTSVAGGA